MKITEKILKNAILSHNQLRSLHNKIFGTWLIQNSLLSIGFEKEINYEYVY